MTLRSLADRPLVVAILFFALSLALYSFGFSDAFKALDDHVSIVDNIQLRSSGGLKDIFTTSFFGGKSYYRPMVSLSFLAEYRLFGLNAFYYYLDNALLHAFVAVLLFLFLRPVLRNRCHAFIAALVFLIHPVQWEAVANVPGRAVLLSAAFTLITWLCYQKSEQRKLWLAPASISFFMALFSKESAMVFPVLAAAYEVWILKNTSWRRILGRILPFALAAFTVLAVRRGLGITHVVHWSSTPQALMAFSAFLTSLLIDLRLLLIPVGYFFDRSLPVPRTLLQPAAVLGLSVGLVAATVLFRFRLRIAPEDKFFLLWFILPLVPVCQLFYFVGIQPGVITNAEHLLYVPSMGLLAVAVRALFRAADHLSRKQTLSPSTVPVLAGALIIFLCMQTVQNDIYAANQVAMYTRTVEAQPYNLRVRYCLGVAYARRGEYEKAEHHFREGLKVNPYHARLRIGLGKALTDQGRLLEGLQQYEMILDPGADALILEQNKAITRYFLLKKKEKELLNKAD